ncbi:hypothetical protein F5Y17DRAFT_467011 [Xylariaceae sp. FL0594]|nr:hypothetical protein F5Y17DRAFT_467011 [Xylariaceae sp. FL0594]
MDRREVIPGANDRKHTAQILVWFIYIAPFLTVAARLGTKYALVRKLGQDDYLMIAAQGMCLAQCVAVSWGLASGLGKFKYELSAVDIDNFLKAEYVGVVLWIISMTLVKWSISDFIRQLNPVTMHRQLELALRAALTIWLLTSVLCLLFQCAPPRPWDYIHGTKCVSQRALWAYISVMNILTDMAIVALFILIIARLQMSGSRKALVLSLFLTRLLVVGVSVVQLQIFLKQFSYSDPTDALWLPILLNQAVLATSTVTACVPYLKPFMESLESGIIRLESVQGPQERYPLGSIWGRRISPKQQERQH